jgi:agmatine deiminase
MATDIEMPDLRARVRFRMPAEWESHEATWIAWPHEKSDWPGKFMPIPWVYASIVKHLARVERVRILVEDAEAEDSVRRILRKGGASSENVEFFHVKTNRSWTRDYGPIFVRDEAGEKFALDWHFNGWAKYDNWQADDSVSEQLASSFHWPLCRPERNGKRLVLEGGAVDVNGAGSILVTEECLLSSVQARNPGLSREDMEAVFRDFLGASHTLWLRNGIAGDDTHGHIDDLARFIDERTIVIASEPDPKDANYEPLRENLALLREMRGATGEPFRIETLPMPEPVYFAGQRLPASYANFYIANETVLVPTFNDKNDRVALNTLAELFPDRAVIGIACTDLVLGLGTLHCMTQQQPA